AAARTIEARLAKEDEWGTVGLFVDLERNDGPKSLGPQKYGAAIDAMVRKLAADGKLDDTLRSLGGPDLEWFYVPVGTSPNYMPRVMFSQTVEDHASADAKKLW